MDSMDPDDLGMVMDLKDSKDLWDLGSCLNEPACQIPYYLLGIGKSYGLTAQHMQDYPIFFIQLNYVHNNKIKIRCCHLMVNSLPQGGTTLGIPLPLSQFSHFA